MSAAKDIKVGVWEPPTAIKSANKIARHYLTNYPKQIKTKKGELRKSHNSSRASCAIQAY
jgi:hypothetical protein